MSLFYQKAAGLDKKRYIWGMDILTVYMISIMVLVPSIPPCLVDGGGLSLQDYLSREERDLKRILLVYLSVSATGVVGHVLLSVYPSLFVRLNVVCLLCFVLPSIFYRSSVSRGWASRRIPASPLSRTRAAGGWRCWSGRASCLSTCGRDRGESGDSAGTVVYPLFTLKPLLRLFWPLVLYPLRWRCWYLIIEGEREGYAGSRAGGLGDLLVGVSIASLLSSVLPTFIPRSRF